MAASTSAQSLVRTAAKAQGIKVPARGRLSRQSIVSVLSKDSGLARDLAVDLGLRKSRAGRSVSEGAVQTLADALV